MNAPATGLRADVLGAVERLRVATSRTVLVDLQPARPGLTLTTVSGALGQLYLRQLLSRQCVNGVFRYRIREWPQLPPCVGERLRDSVDPYLRNVE